MGQSWVHCCEYAKPRGSCSHDTWEAHHCKPEAQDNQRCRFSPSPKAWEPREPRSSLSAGEHWCPSSETGNDKAFLLPRPFMLVRLSVVWIKPTHIERSVCFPQSRDSNVTLTQKHPHNRARSNVCPNVWVPHGLVKLTNKIHHHTYCSVLR